jgi:hypothetical protein
MATMTRQHFNLIAKTIADQYTAIPASNIEQLVAVHEVAVNFSHALRATNSNFDAERFMKAALPDRGSA